MAANEDANGHTEAASDLEKKIIKQIEVSLSVILVFNTLTSKFNLYKFPLGKRESILFSSI